MGQDSKVQSSVNKRITEARTQKGLNQAQLCELADITPAALSQIESGARTPSLPVLQRLAEALGVSMDYLAGRTTTSEFEDVLQHEGTRNFYEGFYALSAEDQSTIMKNIDFLRNQAEQAKRKSRGRES